MENGPHSTQTTANSVVITQPAENGFPDGGPQTEQPKSNSAIITKGIDPGYVDPGEVWLCNGDYTDPRTTNGVPNKTEDKERKKKKEKAGVNSTDCGRKDRKSVYSNYNPDPLIDDSGCDLLGLFCCVSCCSCDCSPDDGCCGDGCDIDLNCCD